MIGCRQSPLFRRKFCEIWQFLLGNFVKGSISQIQTLVVVETVQLECSDNLRCNQGKVSCITFYHRKRSENHFLKALRGTERLFKKKFNFPLRLRKPVSDLVTGFNGNRHNSLALVQMSHRFSLSQNVLFNEKKISPSNILCA